MPANSRKVFVALQFGLPFPLRCLRISAFERPISIWSRGHLSRAISLVKQLGSVGNELLIEQRSGRVQQVVPGGNAPAPIVNGAPNGAAFDLAAGGQVQLITRRSRKTRGQNVVRKNAILVRAGSAHIVYGIAIPDECAVLYHGTRVLEDGQDARVGEGQLTGMLRHYVRAEV